MYYKSIHDTFLFVNTEYGQNDLYQVNILNYFVYLLYEISYIIVLSN